MKHAHWLSLALVGTVSAISPVGCGMHSPAASSSHGQASAQLAPSSGGAGSGGAPMTEGASMRAQSSVQQSSAPSQPPASASSVPSSAEAAPRSAPVTEIPPETRPGLATQWGETLYSSLSYEPFYRASTTPFAMGMIHYNDAQGAMTQAAYRGGGTPVQYLGVYNNGVHISLRDENGSPLPGTASGERLYVIGQHGQRYTIMLENTTPLRLEAVVTVDGLDVMNGQPGDLSHRGYILRPYATLTIEGFRQSENTVAAFRFGTVADSYANQATGSARNVGVIGVALFNEAGAVIQTGPSPAEVQIRESANPFPGRFAPPPPVRTYP